MRARVFIMPKLGVLDPQGQAISRALTSLGFAGVGEVRQGKVIDLELSETDRANAQIMLEEMCRKLLANPIIESHRIELIEDEGNAVENQN